MPQPTRFRLNWMLALICVPIFVGALDLTVVSAVLPHVIVDLEIPLQTGLDQAAWLVTGYLLAYSVSILLMGRLSDLVYRRRVYLLALCVFALGSYLVASASGWPTRLILRGYYMFFSGRPDIPYVTLNVLIAARMIQAFGAGSMVPVGMALVGDLYPPGKRARPLGVIAAVDTAGWVVGHLYGGVVARFWDWRVIFWLNLPVCLAAFILIWYLLRGLPQNRSRGKMDWLGALLVTAALTLLILGLGGGSESHSNLAVNAQSDYPHFAWPLLLAAAIVLGFFIWYQSKASHPLVDLALFRLKNFFPAILANLLVGFSLFIAIANVPIFINTLVATSVEKGAWDSGWMLCALTVPMALTSFLGGWLSDRGSYRFPGALGLSLAFIGFLLMSGWKAETPFTGMVPHLVLSGIGIGLTMAPISSAVINAAPADKRGTSSALVILFRLIGMTIGVSSITTFDIQRVHVLSEKLLLAAPGLGETARVGMEVVEQVIGETFLIAGSAAILAMLPILFLKNHEKKSEVENDQ